MADLRGVKTLQEPFEAALLQGRTPPPLTRKCEGLGFAGVQYTLDEISVWSARFMVTSLMRIEEGKHSLILIG